MIVQDVCRMICDATGDLMGTLNVKCLGAELETAGHSYVKIEQQTKLKVLPI